MVEKSELSTVALRPVRSRQTSSVGSHAMRHIIQSLNAYAQTFASDNKKILRNFSDQPYLPEPLQELAWLGEAQARIRFTKVIKPLVNPSSQLEPMQSVLKCWDVLLSEGVIFDMLAHSGIFRAIATQARIPEPSPKQALLIYFALIAELSAKRTVGPSNEHNLLGLITDTFWRYRLSVLFPKDGVVEKRTSLQTLKQRLQHSLQKELSLVVELRESFDTTTDSASVTIRYRTLQAGKKGEWYSFEPVTATRLKPAKIQAYKNALEHGVSGAKKG